MRFYVILILALAIFLRLYNFSGNFTIDGDGGRDVMIAQEAIHRGEIPLTGAFTSTGPFVFGPAFYWFIISAYLFFPFGLVSPWILMFIVALGFVIVMMLIGFQLGGKRLAIIIGFLAATSPQMVLRSKVLTQHTLVAITTAMAMLCFVILWQRKKALFAFLLGISLGLALSLHYQAINLFLFLPVVLLIPKTKIKTKIFYLFLTAVGFFLPSLPLLVWDSQQNFANVNNILDYFLIGQYRLYVPASWKLFLFTQFPSYFAFVTGGILPVGLTIFFASTFSAIRSRGVVFVLVLIYLVLLFFNRYYHGERFEGYLIYFVPFILLFSAIFLEKLVPLVLVAVLGLNIWSTTQLLVNNKYNFSAIERNAREIWQSYNYWKISLYQNNQNSSVVAYPLYLALLKDKAIGHTGSVPLGVLLDSSSVGYHLIDLRNLGSDKDRSWNELSQKAIYDDLIGWLQKRQLRSSFSLSKYLQERLP